MCRISHYRCEKIRRKGRALLKGKKYLAQHEIELIENITTWQIRNLPLHSKILTPV